MSAIEPLNVTVDLPASEMMEHEGEIFVRCQKHRGWIPMTDYYSESEALLPLVGNANCNHAPVGAEPCDWSEVVRILPDNSGPAEGGTLGFNVADSVEAKPKFGP